jgi:hypothetical protein
MRGIGGDLEIDALAEIDADLRSEACFMFSSAILLSGAAGWTPGAGASGPPFAVGCCGAGAGWETARKPVEKPCRSSCGEGELPAMAVYCDVAGWSADDAGCMPCAEAGIGAAAVRRTSGSEEPTCAVCSWG